MPEHTKEEIPREVHSTCMQESLPKQQAPMSKQLASNKLFIILGIYWTCHGPISIIHALNSKLAVMHLTRQSKLGNAVGKVIITQKVYLKKLLRYLVLLK